MNVRIRLTRREYLPSRWLIAGGSDKPGYRRHGPPSGARTSLNPMHRRQCIWHSLSGYRCYLSDRQRKRQARVMGTPNKCHRLCVPVWRSAYAARTCSRKSLTAVRRTSAWLETSPAAFRTLPAAEPDFAATALTLAMLEETSLVPVEAFCAL